MRADHQEAMAHGVVSVMGENYAALEDIFKGMGILNTEVGDLRRAGVTEPFGEAIARCMSGGGGGGVADERGRKRIVQNEDGADRRRAFGQVFFSHEYPF